MGEAEKEAPATSAWYKQWRWPLGILALLCVVCIWVGSSVLMQYIFEDSDFDHPFFLTYFSTSLFSIYLLEFFGDLYHYVRDKNEPKGYYSQRVASQESLSSPVSEGEEDKYSINTESEEVGAKEKEEEGTVIEDPVTPLFKRKVKSESDETLQEDETRPLRESSEATKEDETPMTVLQVARTALIFCPIWFAANYTFNKSVSLTSVSSNTVLSSTSSLGTLLLGSLVGVDSFSVVKLFAVILSLGGVSLISFTDTTTSSNDNSLIGDLLSLLSAGFFSIYVVLLKKLIKNESRLNSRKFFGFVGLFNVCLMWPFGFLLNYIGLEPFAFPPHQVWLYLTINGLIGTVLSDYLWLLSVLLTSPLVSTVGLSLTIPLAMIADVILKGKTFTFLYFLGTVLVVSGFLLVNTNDILMKWIHKGKDWVVKKWQERRHKIEEV